MSKVRVGVGGWVFPPWRGSFYPAGLRQADELAFASRRLSAIEINATYYSRQSRASFAKWAAQTPEDFVFTLKASRFCTNRRVLGDGGEAIGRFFDQGMAALGSRLGPILWQLAQTKRFEADDMARFLDLLPREVEGRRLRHAVEPRHASFGDDRFVGLCRERGVAICASDHPDWPLIPEATADFAYARLMRGEDAFEAAYPAEGLDAWAARLAAWRDGAEGAAPPRDVFAFIISGGKPRAPMGAMALIERLG